MGEGRQRYNVVTPSGVFNQGDYVKKIKREKKLSLNKETVANLRDVDGGLQLQDRRMSDGPMICLISDCSPCD